MAIVGALHEQVDLNDAFVAEKLARVDATRFTVQTPARTPRE